MQNPEQQITIQQAISNLHNVVEHNFVGKKQEHLALQRSIEKIVETITSLEGKVNELKGLVSGQNIEEKSREG